VTNQTLGTHLRALTKPFTKAWDLLLLQDEFTYNKSPSNATRLSPFKMVYGIDPLSPLDLTSWPLDQKPSVDVAARVEKIQKRHELVKDRIEKTNASNQAQANKHRNKVVFQPGDLVWIHVPKERFPLKGKNKG